MNDQEKEATLNDLEGRLSSAGAPGNLIQAIIAAILALLGGGGCPAPVPSVNKQPMLSRLRIRAALREQGVPFVHLSQAADSVVRLATTATDEEVTRVMGCVE